MLVELGPVIIFVQPSVFYSLKLGAKLWRLECGEGIQTMNLSVVLFQLQPLDLGATVKYQMFAVF